MSTPSNFRYVGIREAIENGEFEDLVKAHGATPINIVYRDLQRKTGAQPRKPEERARELLNKWLTPSELRQFEDSKHVDIKSTFKNRAFYRVLASGGVNMYVYRPKTDTFDSIYQCVHTPGYNLLDDIIDKIVSIKTDEKLFRNSSNAGIPYPSHIAKEGIKEDVLEHVTKGAEEIQASVTRANSITKVAENKAAMGMFYFERYKNMIMNLFFEPKYARPIKTLGGTGSTYSILRAAMWELNW